MMVITYAQHQALTARQTTPRPRPRGSRRATPKDGDVGCWHCGITGHIRRDCHKRLADETAKGAVGGVGGGGGPGGPPAAAVRADGGGGEATYAVEHKCHLVLAAAGGANAFAEDPVGHVILDIGATATIAGAAWVAAYVARLDSASRAEIRSVDASAVFTFGGGASQRAVEQVTLPIRVGDQRCHVTTWVVAGSLPLLLSRASLASMGAVLDVHARRMLISSPAAAVSLALSGAGHLTFNALTGVGAEEVRLAVSADVHLVLVAILTKDSTGLDRAVRKLHTQYGHCAAARLIGLLKDQGVSDPEVFRAVVKAVVSCDACRRDAPRPPRPLVSIPRSLPFNDTVAVDLAYIPPHATFLHMVDVGSRFSKAVEIPNKETVTVTRAMLAGWLVHHGAPRAILADSGAEFDSALFRSMTERFNVVALSTAGQAHHSNGIVERHNQTLKAMVRRLRRDHPAAPLQELLDLACLAKNSMSIHNGASPFQLMCGSAPRLPAALTDSLPALGDRRVPGDDALRTHLSLLHAARAAHTQSEADVSLRRALARNASNVPPRRWAVGDVVYYWTEGVHFSPGAWEGPAHVTDVAVAKDAVRLQHGNRWVTRHGSQVRPVVSAAVAFNEPAAPPAPAEGASASSLDSASSSALSSDSEADAPSPSSDATASMLAGARAALRRVGSPPPAAPPVQSAWAGRTRQGGDRRVRFSALPANANGSAEAALLSRRLSEQGGLAEYAVGLAIVATKKARTNTP